MLANRAALHTAPILILPPPPFPSLVLFAAGNHLREKSQSSKRNSPKHFSLFETRARGGSRRVPRLSVITRRAFLSREIFETTRGAFVPSSATVNKNHKANETDVSAVGIMVKPLAGIGSLVIITLCAGIRCYKGRRNSGEALSC